MGKIIVVIIGLIAAGAIFFMYTKPTYDSLQSTRAQIATYDTALAKATELQQLRDSLTQKYNSFNPDDIAKLQKLLPDHVDNVKLILDLDNLAQSHGMALQNVDVQSQDAGAASGSTGTIAATQQKVNSIQMHFTTQGTYDDFLKFLTDIEQSLRIVDLSQLQITTSQQSSGQPVYGYDVTLRTYWLK